MNCDAKLEKEKLIGCFKNDKTLVNFNQSTQKSQKCGLWLVPFVEKKKKIEEKLTCGLEHDMKDFTNFNQSTWKCQNRDFSRIFLSKVENEWA